MSRQMMIFINLDFRHDCSEQYILYMDLKKLNPFLTWFSFYERYLLIMLQFMWYLFPCPQTGNGCWNIFVPASLILLFSCSMCQELTEIYLLLMRRHLITKDCWTGIIINPLHNGQSFVLCFMNYKLAEAG